MVLKKNQILDIVYYSSLSLFILFFILNSELGNLDELWSFSYARNISNGLLPYKDFNVVSTPLSMFINSLFLLIKQNLFTFRIAYFIYNLAMIYLLNKITNLLGIKTLLKYLLIFVSTYLLLLNGYLGYNFVQFVLILLLVYLSLKNKNYENKKLNILIPIIAGLTIVNKQSTGLIICIVTIALIFLNKKQNKKIIIKQILIMLIPSVLFVLYLLISNSFLDFYDLSILGLTTFSNKLILPILVIIIIVLCIMMTILLRKYRNREMIIIYCYAIASLSVVIPIIDLYHTSIGVIIIFMFFTYVLDRKLKRICSNYSIILIVLITILSISNIFSYINSTKITIGIYKNIPARNDLIKSIDNINQFVLNESKNHDVYILDFAASLYNLSINKYNKYFDLFMNGNFGIKGEKEMYSILEKKNQVVLISNNVINWQCPKEIVNKVQNTYRNCGKIEKFDVYCN